MSRSRALHFIPGVIWLIIIFILLTLPGPDIPKSNFFDIVYFDKWVHIGLFGILMILWGYPFLRSGAASKNLLAFIAVCSVLYGITMEFVQKYFAIERSFDLFDMVADSIGVIIAWLWLINQIKKQNIKNKPL